MTRHLDERTKRRVGEAALRIIDAFTEAARLDAGFDAGEFSGPAAHRAERRALELFGAPYGLDADDVYDLAEIVSHDDGSAQLEPGDAP